MSCGSRGSTSSHCFYLLHFLCRRLWWLTMAGLQWPERCFGIQGKSIHSLCVESKQMFWCSAAVTVFDKNAAEEAVYSHLGMSQHHTEVNTLASCLSFCKYNASPTPTVVRCDSFLFFGSFSHTHLGLWLISLCSHVFRSAEAFGRRSPQRLFISSCFHDIISAWIWSSGLALPLEPSREITEGQTEIFNNELRDPETERTSRLVICWPCTVKCTLLLVPHQGWNLKVEVYLHSPQPQSSNIDRLVTCQILSLLLPQGLWIGGNGVIPATSLPRQRQLQPVREVEASVFNILLMLWLISGYLIL